MDDEELFGGESPVPVKSDDVVVKTGLSFNEAIDATISGSKVRRQEWSDPSEYCALLDSFLKIFKDGKLHNWIVSEGDVLALDWEIL